MAADAVSPDLRPKAPGKGSGNSSDNPSTQGQPQTTPDPLPAPNADAADQHRQASRQILATWLRSTGSRMPEAGLVAAVERVLADALRAGEPTERVTDVLAHWQQEDGTDPARLTTMIGNASDTRASDRPATAAGGAATANPKPLGGWELKDLEAATVAVTNPWLATLAVKPTDEMLEDIEYHISSAFIAGHRHERLAAALAAWHASGSTDPWHLADLIDNWPTVIETQPPDDPQAADRGAREWLTYAPKATA